MSSHSIPPPSPQTLLSPLLSSLPAATVSSTPPSALLPLLSPILRQRVQILSSASSDPWLHLLCYDASKASQLARIAASERFEPHPASGEVEIDCENVGTIFKRLDAETLKALMLVREVGLAVWCVWCTGDAEGGGDGWRIGEVTVLNEEDARWGTDGIQAAEKEFAQTGLPKPVPASNGAAPHAEEEAEDDDAYWAQYDATPSQTPAVKSSPAPANNVSHQKGLGEEDAYYAQYAQVQPAMDNHDPDEEEANGKVESTLGHDGVMEEFRRTGPAAGEEESGIISPRPSSSNGSSGGNTVERLERSADVVGRSDIAVRQHISTSMKSLYRLARAAGMERMEFEDAVKRELDVLEMLEDEE